MPASRTPLPLHPLVLFGVALLGGTLVWQPGLAARGGQQPPSAERQRVERLSQRAMDRVRALQTEADELASRERTLLGEIRRLEIDRQIRTEELGVIDGDLAETTGQLEDTATRISDLEREADAQRPLVEARLVALYKMGTPRYTRLLLGAGDLRALGRNYRLIGSLARRDREQFDDLRETVTDLQVSRSTLEARQVEVAALQEAARAARRALDRTIASQTALVEEIDTRRDLTAQLAGELEAAREQLEAPLAELAAGGSPGATTLALPLRPFRGQIEPPVPGEVTVPFGAPRPTEFGTTIAGGGIELAATPGESVYAIHEGEVVSVGTFEGLGTLVIVSHGDQAFSLYGYLASLAVHEGGQVDERAELGTAGVSPTGDATVYFELRIDGRPVDPVEWLKQ
ncbi:MAG: peptidoglycan DD-metalloendopeptidase family protein [Vicinamibacterales bacterium]|nr:peptidoglycan DD-metalloendopeptidase family protein [Vicinamibacterales bacterium]